jgi:hypothetical protein
MAAPFTIDVVQYIDPKNFLGQHVLGDIRLYCIVDLPGNGYAWVGRAAYSTHSDVGSWGIYGDHIGRTWISWNDWFNAIDPQEHIVGMRGFTNPLLLYKSGHYEWDTLPGISSGREGFTIPRHISAGGTVSGYTADAWQGIASPARGYYKPKALPQRSLHPTEGYMYSLVHCSTEREACGLSFNIVGTEREGGPTIWTFGNDDTARSMPWSSSGYFHHISERGVAVGARKGANGGVVGLIVDSSIMSHQEVTEVWDKDGSPVDAPNIQLWGLNEADWAVGFISGADGEPTDAIVITPHGQAYSLSSFLRDRGVTALYTESISSQGLIACYGYREENPD